MKYRDNVWLAIVGSLALAATSCTKDADVDYVVEKPESLEAYEYLKSYSPLKDYVKEGFHLGAAVDAAQYNDKGEIYALVNSNFNEVVATYHMKHDQVVKDDGTMDFTTVDKFVDIASEAGLDIFGHVLCWHSGQNTSYLNSLVEDKIVPIDPDVLSSSPSLLSSTNRVMPTYVTRSSTNLDWVNKLTENFDTADNKGTTFDIWNVRDEDGDKVTIADGVLTIVSGKQGPSTDYGNENYHPQMVIKVPAEFIFKAGERWQLTFDAKSLSSSNIEGICVQGEGVVTKYYGPITTSTTSETKTLPIDVNTDGLVGGGEIILGFGAYADTFTIDNIALQREEEVEPPTDDTWEKICSESDFSGKNWSTFAVDNCSNPGDSFAQYDDGGNKVMKIVNAEAGENWQPQYIALLPWETSFAAGEVWKMTMKIKSEEAHDVAMSGVSVQSTSATLPDGGTDGEKYFLPSYSSTTEWTTIEVDLDIDERNIAGGSRIVFGLGTESGTYYIDDVEFFKKSASTGGGDGGSSGGDDDDDDDDQKVNYDWGYELIDGGTFEGVSLDAGASQYETESGKLLLQANGGSAAVGAGYNMDSNSEEGSSIILDVPNKLANPWDAQVLVQPKIGAFAASDIIKVEFDVKSDNGTSITKAFAQTADYHEPFSYGAVKTVAGQWTHYEIIFTGATNADKFAMQFGDAVDKFYFDNFSMKMGRIIPDGYEVVKKNEAEKTKAVTNAMSEWVKAMIDHTKDKVEVWDLVNETIMDVAPYKLRSTENGDSVDGAFYYADYMGDDYVCEVVKMARAAAGDKALTLFINDYGLEWYGNAKLDALLAQIVVWESDGTTKFDGIGSQMHIEQSVDAEAYKQQQEGVVKMLEKLSKTGKLVRISEIDIVLKLADGTPLMAADATEEQHKYMSEFYEFIVSKYFEIVPEAQQFGIAHWSIIDAPDVEGAWKRNEPCGLWTKEYNRKHTYGGFADGLMSNE